MKQILDAVEKKMDKVLDNLEANLRTIRTGRANANMLERVSVDAIGAANLGLVPQNDGEVIRINVPALTEDRRKELAKEAHKYGEEAKVAIRNNRREGNDMVKKDKELTEDMKKDAQEKIQKTTDSHVKKIDAMVKEKADEIMSV